VTVGEDRKKTKKDQKKRAGSFQVFDSSRFLSAER